MELLEHLLKHLFAIITEAFDLSPQAAEQPPPILEAVLVQAWHEKRATAEKTCWLLNPEIFDFKEYGTSA